MFGLAQKTTRTRYGAVVDIGSGSVGVAIVASDPAKSLPEIVWAHREWTTIRDLEQIDDAAKDIATATMNAFLELGNQGLKTLREHTPKAKLEQIQVSICAPWSYTIAKSVSSTSDEQFDITKSLVIELVDTAQSEALAVIDTEDFMQKMGLSVISDATISISANGYVIKNPIGQSVETITVTQLTGVTEERLLRTAKEASKKVLPSVSLETTTFMYHYYLALQEIIPDTTEVCLFDVTSEATEIGIIRNGILRYVTHMPFGTRTIAREISAACGIPKEEALGYIKTNNLDLAPSLTDNKQSELQAIIDSYHQKLADLMQRTGDSLAIPKTVYLHTDTLTEHFFKQSIEQAGKISNKVEHAVHPITSKLFGKTNTADTGILVSSYVFHKKLHPRSKAND